MCGFVLAYAPDPSNGRSGYLHRACHTMRSRGTEAATYSRPAAGWRLAHIRLPLQSDPTSESTQPFEIPGGVMSYVGELFSPDGYVHNEEERFVEAVFDNRVFSEFDGFWSVAHLDDRNGLVHVYTDHLGIKPIYYSESERVISSDLRSILASSGGGWTFDNIYLSNVIKFGYDYSGRTPYTHIRQVPPGHRLTFDRHGDFVSCRPYYRIGVGRIDLQSAFLNSVEGRIKGIHPKVTDRPALLLSGGLDSSLVYYAVKALGLADRIDCFTFPNGPDAGFVPDETNARVLPDLEVEEDEIVKAVSAMQAPLDLGSLVPQYRLARAIHETTGTGSIVLSGDGADELFGGYRRAKDFDSQASDTFCELPYYHLPRLDRIHMDFTQEVRSPFLAPQVLQSALFTPRELRTEKQALKDLARELEVPSEIINRPKFPLKATNTLEAPTAYRSGLVDTFKNLPGAYRYV